MIKIERPEFRSQCNCCFSREGVKEIHFLTDAGGYNGTMVCLCAKCQKELKEEIERHGEKE